MARLEFRGTLGVALTAAILLLFLSADALAAARPSVSLKAAASTVAAGTTLRLMGAVVYPKVGARSVTILRRAGTTWRRVASARLSPGHTFVVKVTLTKVGIVRLLAQYAPGGVKVRSKAVKVTVTPSARGWALVACGGSGSLAVNRAGELWAWGGNRNGQLGLGTSDADAHPTPGEIGGNNDWASVSSGEEHSLAVKKDGTLWAWGGDSDGQLGLGDIAPRPAPMEVGDASGWAAVTCGDHSSFAVRRDGTLWAWGANGDGELGLGDIALRYAPTQVGVATDWAGVSCGHGFTLALKKDGTLWAWGWNGNGQLGLGDTNERVTPTQVGDLAAWASVSAGDSFTVAVEKNGTLWAWGYNGNGQLGLGKPGSDPRLSPAQVGADHDWSTVACGAFHTVALKKDGTLWAWGWNGDGQLGVDDTTDRDVPTQVGGASDWASVDCGDYHTEAVKTDATLWGWGFNGSGELGIGTSDTDPHPTPAKVGSASS